MMLIDAITLGVKKITSHKKRSLMSVITVGVLFSLLFFSTILYAGFKNLLFESSLGATGGEAILAFGQCDFNEDKCSSVSEMREQAELYAKKYQADFKGEIKIYKTQLTDDEKAIQNAMANQYQDYHPQEYRYITVFPEIFIDGIKKKNAHSASIEEIPSFIKNPGEFNFLELMFSNVNKQISIVPPETDLQKQKSACAMDGDSCNNELVFVRPVLSFKNIDNAIAFYEENNSAETIIEPIGNVISIYNSYGIVKKLLSTVGTILVIISVVIMVFTFIKLINEESSNIALYRSIGAKPRDVFGIFSTYIIGLCSSALVFSVLAGGISAIFYSTINASKISDILSQTYMTDIQTGILIGFDTSLIFLVVAIYFSGVTCLILTIDQLSLKNISKRLKQ